MLKLLRRQHNFLSSFNLKLPLNPSKEQGPSSLVNIRESYWEMTRFNISDVRLTRQNLITRKMATDFIGSGTSYLFSLRWLRATLSGGLEFMR